MQGELTGTVLDHSITAQEITVTLAGITANDKAGVTWIHKVRFTGSRKPAELPAKGTAVRVTCIAAKEHFTGRGGARASRVVIHGLTLTPTLGSTQVKGQVTFLLNAVNRFTFAGHVVRLTLKPKVGVTELRLGVTDKTGAVHYFDCEGWRSVGQDLAARRTGAEMELSCILRRDRVDGDPQRAFDVMEVQAMRAASAQRSAPRPTRPATAPAYANAAD